jgi:hypothetical protein
MARMIYFTFAWAIHPEIYLSNPPLNIAKPVGLEIPLSGHNFSSFIISPLTPRLRENPDRARFTP